MRFLRRVNSACLLLVKVSRIDCSTNLGVIFKDYHTEELGGYPSSCVGLQAIIIGVPCGGRSALFKS